MEVNRDIYLKNFPIDEYVSFIEKREHTSWDWTKAEQHGKWIESAYLSAIQSDDKELLDKVDTILKRISFVIFNADGLSGVLYDLKGMVGLLDRGGVLPPTSNHT